MINIYIILIAMLCTIYAFNQHPLIFLSKTAIRGMSSFSRLGSNIAMSTNNDNQGLLLDKLKIFMATQFDAPNITQGQYSF